MVDNLKLVLVGDTGVGKSSLAFTYGSGTFPAGFRPCFNGINNKHDMMLGDDTLVTIEIVIAPSEYNSPAGVITIWEFIWARLTEG